MRRLQGAIGALALAVLVGPAAAAEITRVASSGEAKNPFDLDVSVRWDRTDERATITREKASGTAPGTIVLGDDLRYGRTRDAIVPRIAVGLWHDLELHAELPYVLGDDRTWRYGLVGGQATGPGADSISTDPVTVQGLPCVGACQLFPVAPKTTDYHGGRVGDLKAGITWGIFNDRKDDTKPFWLVGMDLTFPTAARYEPGKGRTADTWASPFGAPAEPGPFGERIWKWDVYTAMSRRLGMAEPYVKAHFQTAFKSASTYSNCDAVREATATSLDSQQMNDLAVANCASWGSEAGAKLPWVAGLTFGTELVPYEDAFEGQRVSVDLRVFADYTSRQRFYNELTDATGKLHMTQGYLEMGALAGLYVRASKYVLMQATASLSTRTAHYLTGEALGKGDSWPAVLPSGQTSDPAAMNPNFDWRYDAPGRRFRISEVSVFELSVGGVLQF